MESSTAGSRSSLVYTKVRLPRLSNLLSRPRLLDWLHEHIHRKLLLVCAGPGYGKTSLLVDFSRSADLPVCWYTLDPSDRDPRTFLDYLVEAVRVHFPSFGRRTREFLREATAGSLREAVGLLVNDLSEEIAEYVVVVLDDYHTVEDQEEVNLCLDTLIAYLPEHVHLILASRSVPPLSLARLAAYGEAEAIGREDLRFTAEEASAVLRQSLQVDLPEAVVRQLVEESEGWIAGILLRAQAGRKGIREALAGLPRFPNLYDYLAEEVLRRLDPEERRFLCGAAIPRQVDAPFCDALLERRDSARLLSSLERRDLFLIPLEGGWYRFHSLFREFLLREARADEEAYRRLQQRAAQVWQARGEQEEAVEHLLQAQAWEEATEEIEALARSLYERSRFATLIRWTEALPSDLLDRRPRLLLFLSKVYLQAGQEDRAWPVLQRVEKVFVERGDRERRIQALADRAVLERMRGQYREALETVRQALAAWMEGEELPALVDLHRTAAICLLALGDSAGAEEHVRAAVAHSRTAGPYNRALAYLDLGFCLRAQGRMEEADAAYQQALEQARSAGSPELEANILNNLAMGLFLRGELFPALELLEQAQEAARTALSPRLQAVIEAGLGDLYRDLGERARARQAYQEGLDQARRAHNADLVAYLLEALGNLSRQEGNLPEARRLLEEALAVATSSPRDRTRIEASIALLEAAEGRPEEALRRLGETVRRQEEARWHSDRLRSLLARALILHRSHRPEPARESLQEALETARRLNILEPFLAEREALFPLLEQLPRPAGEDFLSQVLECLQRGPRPRAVVEEKTPPLRILALGKGRVFRGEEEIPTSAWGYRQARELFFFLFFNAPAGRGEIGLAFWPDRSPSRVTSAFHAALFQARRALGCFFVLFRDEKYHWNPEVPYWCDVLEFERLLDRAEEFPADDPQAIPFLEQALDLYQGDFLEDIDREWCFLRREELGRRRMQALLRLGRLYLNQGKADPARRAFLRALQVDNYNEEAYRGLMRSQVLSGERIAALRTYHRCSRLLRRELGIEPSEETRSLYQAIREGKFPS
ncbi:MAG: tetratricopeptide repeat protein [Chloroflexia bacterium]